MRAGSWVIAAALVLAACQREAPAPQPAPTGEQESIAQEEALPVMGPKVRILAFGDSLFAGYGVGEAKSYPAMLQNVLRRRGIDAAITKAGVSGDTTQAGLQRLDFTLGKNAEKPDLAIVELGGNDLLRGIPPAVTRRNLDAILTALGKDGIPVLLMGMKAPPNLGADYVTAFDAIYPDLARKHDAKLVPFFLQSVYDKPALIQADHVHPTAPGIEAIVASTVDEVVAALPEGVRGKGAG